MPTTQPNNADAYNMEDPLNDAQAVDLMSSELLQEGQEVPSLGSTDLSIPLLRRAYEDRKGNVRVFLCSGVTVVTLTNLIALTYFFCTLDQFKLIESDYALYAFIIRDITIGIFELCGTYAGVKLIKAAERLTLPTGTSAEQIRALTGESENSSNQPDILKLLQQVNRLSD